ncbi:MAG: hypothetical protein A2X94_03215 [Bdellovibrionales bacterium GWB1_55_8]|nr:MAG: hypothetical protein A2X94_03215 [Bdellovibrionales bacterium GWB1_55_8]
MQAEYFYDALGRRVAKRVTKGSDPAFTQSYMHLGEQDKILLGKSGDGEITLYLDGQGIDEHLGEVSSRGVKTYATDHLGSVLNGEAAGAARAFGAWGENLNATAPAIAASSSPVVYGYTGRQLDAESSTYYYRARTYLPDVGKFAQPDPIFPASGVNPYTYVLNSPLNYVDPDGLDAQVYTTILPWGHGVVGVTDPSSSTGTTYYDYGPKSSSSFGLGTPVPGQVNVMPKYPVPLLPIPGMNYPGTPEQDKKARDRANAIKNLPGELYPYTPIPGLTDLPSGMPGNNCYSFTSDVTSVYRNSGAK